MLRASVGFIVSFGKNLVALCKRTLDINLNKMFKIFIISSLIALTLAADSSSGKKDTITKFASQVNTDGTYGFEVEQSSGLEFKEAGYGGHYAKGAYQYISPEGQYVSVVYTADENGFHPESELLPTPPPIPAYILKALEYIRDHPTAEELADREVRAKQI